MNKNIELQDLGFKDYKQTWDYQETLFKSIVDIKIKNRRENAGLETKNYFLIRKCIANRCNDYFVDI